MLEGESLVTVAGEGDHPLYRATAAGLAELERRGRYPAGAAIVFTDLVASTKLIDRFGEDGAHDRRQRHFALLRRVIESHGGREVKNLGDGLMVVFADPAAAARCSAAMQLAVAEDADRLGLRVGLNSGELLREGGDYFGSTVIVAQRLCENAGPSQIVVSDAARAAVNIDHDLSFTPRGPIDLKGLRKPVVAWLLDWSGENPPPSRGREIRRRHASVAE